ncbi:MAG: hypothetical protein DRO40_02575 [Thermoprotei archaeon]|nr:MAG: hypothetical protein DRO40_02575 [Thermoprotei archaeon]
MEYFSKGYEIAKRVIVLIIINIIVSLLNFNAIARISSFHGIHFGVKLTFPKIILDLWDLVSLPRKGFEIMGVSIVPNTSLLMVIVYLIIYIILYSFLSYAYLVYILKNGLGEPVGAGLNRVLDLIIYSLIFLFIGLAMISFASLHPSLLVVSIFILLIITYFIYAAPFIVVSLDKDVFESINISIKLAKTDTYFKYTLVYVLIIIIASIPATILVVNMKIIGLLLAIIPISFLGLVLTVSTELVIKDLCSRLQ